MNNRRKTFMNPSINMKRNRRDSEPFEFCDVVSCLLNIIGQKLHKRVFED